MDITERNLDVLTGNPNTDPDKTPAADLYAIDPGPGQTDNFVQDKFFSPWRDQRSRMVRHFDTVTLIAAAASATFQLGEAPQWWVVCLQTYTDTAGDIGTLTLKQDPQDHGHTLQGPTNGAAKSVSGMVRAILRAKQGQNNTLYISAVAAAGSTNWQHILNVFAVGEGVDPTKVGLM